MLRLTYATAIVSLLLAILLFGSMNAKAGQAKRLVVVGGALTEIVYALGEGDQVVGVDTSSVWPRAATQLPQVGYQRTLAAEGVLSLHPDLVLLSDDAGPPAVLQQLRQAGVPMELIEVEDSAEGLLRKVERVAEVVGRPSAGARLTARLRAELDALAQQVAQVTDRPRVAFLLSAGRGVNLAAGRDTAAHAAIELAGGRNALAGYSGYKPVNPEAMVAAAPEVLMTTQRTMNELGGIDGLLALPGAALTPAADTRRIEAMDALFLLGFGPRTPAALRELAARLRACSHCARRSVAAPKPVRQDARREV